jgi:hypothetical protein
MRKVTLDEILGLGAYEGVRDRFRARLIEHKRARRVLLGPEMSLVFEDHDTVLLQVQEMLRAERISDPAGVGGELETYNDLVAPDGALLATLMIEINDRDAREARRRELVGLDRALALELGDVSVPGVFAREGIYPDRVAAVHYVTFPLGDVGRDLLLDASREARLVCSHPRYALAVALP